MIYIKYCKGCGKAFDIDTSKDYCPKCRRNLKKMKIKEEKHGKKYTWIDRFK